jgi:hypothetical protein
MSANAIASVDEGSSEGGLLEQKSVLHHSDIVEEIATQRHGDWTQQINTFPMSSNSLSIAGVCVSCTAENQLFSTSSRASRSLWIAMCGGSRLSCYQIAARQTDEWRLFGKVWCPAAWIAPLLCLCLSPALGSPGQRSHPGPAAGSVGIGKGKCLSLLWSRPLRGRMTDHVEVENATTIMDQHQKHFPGFERHWRSLMFSTPHLKGKRQGQPHSSQHVGSVLK